ncbi:MAG: YajQ family cyclic di-GMP-binding protein [Chromatiales bacterium]|nr:YajQ family cyclic di-GMP-binding protein [Chromatiales bacterium]
MPSFDVVSEVDLQEVRNAVDQTNREIGNRFDFKGTDARVEQAEAVLTLHGQNDFQLQQMRDILDMRLTKRSIDIACIEAAEPEVSLNAARQKLTLRQGIDGSLSKQMVKDIKASKIKVQAAVQGEQLRVTGKKRDDLQQVIALLREKDYGLPLQFNNFRD